MENNMMTGETVLTETREFRWIKDISIEANKDVESIDIGYDLTLSLNKRIDFCRFFINYLLYKFAKDLGIDKKSASKVGQEVFEAMKASDDNPMIDRLADLVIESFKANGLGLDDNRVYGSMEVDPAARTVWGKADILEDLKATSIDRDKMLVYGFGLGMDLDELETFLMNVLEETGLNIWDRKEGLTYIAIKQFPEDAVHFYLRANELYDDPLADTFDNSAGKNADLNTISLQNYINEYLETFENVTKVDDDLILDIISYHKELVSQNTGRTIKAEFVSTFIDIEDRLDEEIDIYHRQKYGEPAKTGDMAEFFAIGNIVVSYEADDDIVIGPSTKFVWRDENTSKELVYYPHQNYTLKKSSKEEIAIIKVVSDFYTDKDKVEVLGSDETHDYHFISEIPNIKQVTFGNIYLTNTRITSLLDYLYTEDGLIIEDECELDEDQFDIVEDLLKDTKIEAYNVDAVLEADELGQITRGRITTMFFLDYILANQDLWYDVLSNPHKRKRDYLVYMDRKLRNCRLYEYNLSNPYEDVLLKLILNDEPIDAFRDLWSKYLLNIDKYRS